ncbi:type I-F CRISPR-associated protein Csy3 [Planctobacterium marinum]|uniref:Type I-F CRISPR-associated protein Csy3 n=1 Tax=Planctobacterium marinum TaxID=1631968 RepID=A0AA48HNL3_9ALTE|nr:type I-F CRISPR-associated protein Csy3 [Planctobacterium marinum]
MLPKRLSFQRSISPGQAIFTYSNGCEKNLPVPVQTIKVIGQKGHYTDAFDSNGDVKKATSRQTLAQSNPQTIDVCFAPVDAELVRCRFSLRINANSFSPFLCDEPEFTGKIRNFCDKYKEQGGYYYLAKRYLENIASGLWLWRSKDALGVEITITEETGNLLSIKDIDDGINISKSSDFEKLARRIEETLCEPKKALFLDVTAQIKTAFAQEIHPSQCFTDKEENKASRVYQKTKVANEDTPIFGAYKVGAAVAMIDDWYPDAEKPIRVGSYGADKESATAFRHPETGLDLFSLLKNLEKITAELQESEAPPRLDSDVMKKSHFIAANLIKGGLFNRGKA